MDRAVDAFPDADRIADVNIETLKKLGREGWEALGGRKGDERESLASVTALGWW